MSKTPNATFLRSLPKCEHHLHIEGSLHPTTLFHLAQRNAVALPSATEDPSYASPEALGQRYTSFANLDDFLAYYYRGMAVLQHESDFADLAYDYLTRAATTQGVRHAEIFFDPQAHLTRGISLETVVSGLRAGLARAEAEHGSSWLLVPCFLRHEPAAAALELVRSEAFRAAARRGDFVGVGLDSSEVGFPPELFREVFAEARRLGLRLTAHAGEEGPAANVRAVLEVLGCERVDHGIRVVEDEAVLKEVIARGVMLTVCPLSNVSLRCVKKVEELPIRRFLHQGVKFSINSDDPTYLGGYVLDSYVAVQRAFNFSTEDWRVICENAIRGSWCSDERKDQLLEMLDMTITKFQRDTL